MRFKAFIVAAIVLALGLGLAGGFFAGRRDGQRQAQIQEALAKTLRREMNEARERSQELELATRGLAAQIEKVRADAIQCRDQFDRLMSLQDSVEFVGPVFPDLPTIDKRASTQTRIAQLERDVAALKDQIGEGGATPQETQAEQASDSLVSASAKVQCTAITQKGTRCSRAAKSNGKCWQHGG